jgi:hypothetical protein
MSDIGAQAYFDSIDWDLAREAVNTSRHRTLNLKQRRRSPSVADLRDQLDRRTRELSESLEQQTTQQYPRPFDPTRRFGSRLRHRPQLLYVRLSERQFNRPPPRRHSIQSFVSRPRSHI